MYYIFPYDSSGNLYPHPYYGTKQTMSNPPNGYNLLPAIEDTDATAQAAYAACEALQPQQYIVQDGKLAQNPAWASIQFAQAKAAKQTWLDATLASKVAAGFPSSADGTARRYAIDPIAVGKWTGILAAIVAGIAPATFKVWDVAGTSVVLTQAQYKQFAGDALAYDNTTQTAYGEKGMQIAACTTQAELDTIGWPNPAPPSVPTGLVGTAGTGEVTLTWTVNPDVTMLDGGYYVCYQNGAKVGTATGTTYTATGLTSGAAYQFSVIAVDTDGLESAQCTAISVTPK